MAAPPLKVAVIGAGVGGLATARALKSVANHQIVVYEKSDRLGGTWVYDPRVESDPLGLDPNREIVHGSLYPSLCTNLPRQLMGFWDYPFRTRKNVDDSYYRTFPKHEEVLQFLIEFADEFELTELIRFGSEVTRVERVDSRCDDWVVESRSNGLSSEEVFDAVIVCNGHHTQPRLAHLQGIEKWPGKQLHSHNYRGPELFQDKIVVVIGDGPSGIDISIEISAVAKQVYVSSRDPNITISKLNHKDNIWQHSKINCVHENGEVEFIDGASIFADIILHCTGFEYHMPFLKTDGIVSVDDNRVGPLYKHVFPPKLAPRLSFIGLTYRSLVVMTIDLQAKWVANVLSGKQTLPSEEEMLADTERHYRQMEAKGIPKHHTHRIGHEHFFEYLDWLATEAGYAKVDEETKLITKNYFNFVVENGFWRAKEWAIEYGLEEWKKI